MSITTLPRSVEVFENTIKIPLSDKKAPRFAADAEEKMAKVETALNQLIPFKTFEPESLPSVTTVDDLKVNRQRWAENLVEKITGGDVGRVEWDGDTARCSFYDREEDFGVLNKNVRKIKIVHEVYKPKLRRLPVDIHIPRRGRLAIKALTEAGLGRDIRILTGDLIGEGKSVEKEWTERTALGKMFDEERERREAARRAAEERAALRPTTMRRTFAFDPAILLGRDLVIFMWK